MQSFKHKFHCTTVSMCTVPVEDFRCSLIRIFLHRAKILMDGIQRLSTSDFPALSSPNNQDLMSRQNQLPREETELVYSDSIGDSNGQLAQTLQTQVTSLFPSATSSRGEECLGLSDGGLTGNEGLNNFIQTLAQTLVNAGLGGMLTVSSFIFVCYVIHLSFPVTIHINN